MRCSSATSTSSVDDEALAKWLAAFGSTIPRYRHDLERQLSLMRAIHLFVAPGVTSTDAPARRAELDAKTRAWLDEQRARAEITIDS